MYDFGWMAATAFYKINLNTHHHHAHSTFIFCQCVTYYIMAVAAEVTQQGRHWQPWRGAARLNNIIAKDCRRVNRISAYLFFLLIFLSFSSFFFVVYSHNSMNLFGSALKNTFHKYNISFLLLGVRWNICLSIFFLPRFISLKRWCLLETRARRQPSCVRSHPKSNKTHKLHEQRSKYGVSACTLFTFY